MIPAIVSRVIPRSDMSRHGRRAAQMQMAPQGGRPQQQHASGDGGSDLLAMPLGALRCPQCPVCLTPRVYGHVFFGRSDACAFLFVVFCARATANLLCRSLWGVFCACLWPSCACYLLCAPAWQINFWTEIFSCVVMYCRPRSTRRTMEVMEVMRSLTSDGCMARRVCGRTGRAYACACGACALVRGMGLGNFGAWWRGWIMGRVWVEFAPWALFSSALVVLW